MFVFTTIALRNISVHGLMDIQLFYFKPKWPQVTIKCLQNATNVLYVSSTVT